MLRLYRDPTAEARSPAARSACFPHPVQMSQRGVRAAAVKACLVITTAIFDMCIKYSICVMCINGLARDALWRVHSHANPRPRNRPVKIANARLRKYEF